MMQKLRLLWHRLAFEYHYFRGIGNASDIQTRGREKLAEKI